MEPLSSPNRLAPKKCEKESASSTGVSDRKEWVSGRSVVGSGKRTGASDRNAKALPRNGVVSNL